MDGPAVHIPIVALKGNAIAPTRSRCFPTEKTAVGVETSIGLELGILPLSSFANFRSTADKQIGVRDVRSSLRQNLEQGRRENTRKLFRLPRFLFTLAGG